MRCKAITLLILFLLFFAGTASAQGDQPPIVQGWLDDISALFNLAVVSDGFYDGYYQDRMAAQKLLLERLAESRPYLYEKLTGGSYIEKQTVISILGASGDARDEAVLVELLHANDPILSYPALDALRNIYSRMELAKLLARVEAKPGYSQNALPGQTHPDVRGCAMLAIPIYCETNNVRLATKDIKTILPYLEDSEARVRSRGCDALGYAASPEDAAPALIKILQTDPAEGVKYQAACALGKLKGESRAALQAALEDPDRLLQLEAAAALVRGGEVTYLDILHRAILSDPEEEGSGWLDRASNLLKKDKSSPAGNSVPIGGLPVSGLRWRALALLGELGSPFSEDHLVRLLDDPNWQIRGAAAAALGKLKGVAITQPLRELLHDDNPRVRSKAALALAAQGAVGIHWIVLRDLESPRNDVRYQAAQTLGLLQAEQAVEPLAKQAQSQYLELACSAVVALGMMPGGNPEAIKQLIKLLDDPRFAIQVEASLALKKLTGLPFPTKRDDALRAWQEKNP